ncbi:unnamed protein product [Adineta ricciae]|uniref:Methyltransferase FkbM domain-containing protein n=1 Tax=Adineta ricciae TaxID=249248 RepID=A0A815K265_ADIRI|nr:unnamed protein product [Adineta ricciae]
MMDEQNVQVADNDFKILSIDGMKQFFTCSVRQRIFFLVLLFSILATKFLFTQEQGLTFRIIPSTTTTTTTTSTTTPITTTVTSTQDTKRVYPCLRSRHAIQTSFLGSRSFCIHLLSNDIVSNSIASSHSWMPHQTRLMASLLADAPSKPAVFLDIGANIGWFTLVMASLGHEVIAIEPMSRNIELLRASLQASKISQNVIVHPNGLGVKPSVCILYSDNRNVGDGHTICDITSEKEAIGRIPGGYSLRQVINSTRLDTLVNQNIDVMKIDVEGSELYAVQSGIRLFDKYEVRHVVSEFSPRMMREKRSDPYDYLKFFVSRGYKIRIVNDQLTILFERKVWQSVPVYISDNDLRRLSNGDQVDLLFSKS